MTIGKRILHLRKVAGLTQADLAARVGVGRSTVAQWERGSSQPRLRLLDRIAETLGVGTDELVGSCVDDEDRAEARNEARWTVPLVPCDDAPMGESLGSRVEVPAPLLANHPNAIATVMPDDSMSRMFPAGFVVVLDPDVPPTNGSIVVASVDGRTVVRRWFCGNSTILLVADSHGCYTDVVVPMTDPPEVIGRVVLAQSRDLLA